MADGVEELEDVVIKAEPMELEEMIQFEESVRAHCTDGIATDAVRIKTEPVVDDYNSLQVHSTNSRETNPIDLKMECDDDTIPCVTVSSSKVSTQGGASAFPQKKSTVPRTSVMVISTSPAVLWSKMQVPQPPRTAGLPIILPKPPDARNHYPPIPLSSQTTPLNTESQRLPTPRRPSVSVTKNACHAEIVLPAALKQRLFEQALQKAGKLHRSPVALPKPIENLLLTSRGVETNEYLPSAGVENARKSQTPNREEMEPSENALLMREDVRPLENLLPIVNREPTIKSAPSFQVVFIESTDRNSLLPRKEVGSSSPTFSGKGVGVREGKSLEVGVITSTRTNQLDDGKEDEAMSENISDIRNESEELVSESDLENESDFENASDFEEESEYENESEDERASNPREVSVPTLPTTLRRLKRIAPTSMLDCLPKLPLIKCPICPLKRDLSNYRLSYFIRHVLQCVLKLGKPTVCPHCDESFTFATDMARHAFHHVCDVDYLTTTFLKEINSIDIGSTSNFLLDQDVDLNLENDAPFHGEADSYKPVPTESVKCVVCSSVFEIRKNDVNHSAIEHVIVCALNAPDIACSLCTHIPPFENLERLVCHILNKHMTINVETNSDSEEAGQKSIMELRECELIPLRLLYIKAILEEKRLIKTANEIMEQFALDATKDDSDDSSTSSNESPDTCSVSSYKPSEPLNNSSEGRVSSSKSVSATSGSPNAIPFTVHSSKQNEEHIEICSLVRCVFCHLEKDLSRSRNWMHHLLNCAHKIRDWPTVCPNCDESFLFVSDMIRHSISHFSNLQTLVAYLVSDIDRRPDLRSLLNFLSKDETLIATKFPESLTIVPVRTEIEKCVFCDSILETRIDDVNHLAIEHLCNCALVKGDMKCTKCESNESYGNLQDFMHHLLSDHMAINMCEGAVEKGKNDKIKKYSGIDTEPSPSNLIRWRKQYLKSIIQEKLKDVNHFRSTGYPDDPYLCTRCDSLFHSERHLKKHLSMDGCNGVQSHPYRTCLCGYICSAFVMGNTRFYYHVNQCLVYLQASLDERNKVDLVMPNWAVRCGCGKWNKFGDNRVELSHACSFQSGTFNEIGRERRNAGCQEQFDVVRGKTDCTPDSDNFEETGLNVNGDIKEEYISLKIHPLILCPFCSHELILSVRCQSPIRHILRCAHTILNNPTICPECREEFAFTNDMVRHAFVHVCRPDELMKYLREKDYPDLKSTLEFLLESQVVCYSTAVSAQNLEGASVQTTSPFAEPSTSSSFPESNLLIRNVSCVLCDCVLRIRNNDLNYWVLDHVCNCVNNIDRVGDIICPKCEHVRFRCCLDFVDHILIEHMSLDTRIDYVKSVQFKPPDDLPSSRRCASRSKRGEEKKVKKKLEQPSKKRRALKRGNADVQTSRNKKFRNDNDGDEERAVVREDESREAERKTEADDSVVVEGNDSEEESTEYEPRSRDLNRWRREAVRRLMEKKRQHLNHFIPTGNAHEPFMCTRCESVFESENKVLIHVRVHGCDGIPLNPKVECVCGFICGSVVKGTKSGPKSLYLHVRRCEAYAEASVEEQIKVDKFMPSYVKKCECGQWMPDKTNGSWWCVRGTTHSTCRPIKEKLAH